MSRTFTEEERHDIWEYAHRPGVGMRTAIGDLAQEYHCARQDIRAALGLRSRALTDEEFAAAQAAYKGSKPPPGPTGGHRGKRTPDRVEAARRWRAEGKTYAEIGAALGVGAMTARRWILDGPGGAKDPPQDERSEPMNDTNETAVQATPAGGACETVSQARTTEAPNPSEIPTGSDPDAAEALRYHMVTAIEGLANFINFFDGTGVVSAEDLTRLDALIGAATHFYHGADWALKEAEHD